MENMPAVENADETARTEKANAVPVILGPKSEHEAEAIIESILSKNVSLWNLTPERSKELTRRRRFLEQMTAWELSVERYIDLLHTSQQEREFHGIATIAEIPKRSAMYEWKKAADSVEKLSRPKGGTGRKSKIPNWVVCFILQKLNIDPHVRVSWIYECLEDIGEYWNWYVPAECTISRFVKAIRRENGIQDMLHCIQKKAYFAKYESVVRHHYSHSNDIWETDATRLKIRVQSNGKKEELWLLLTVDCFSGLIMGWTLVVGAPNANDQIRHLRDCLLPKRNGGWGGKPVILQSDNGKIYDCRVLDATCKELGIKLRKSPPYCPAYNGAIERLNDAFKDRMKDMYIDAVKRYYRNTLQRDIFLGTVESLKDTIEKCFEDHCLKTTPKGRIETRLQIWLSGLPDEERGQIDTLSVKRACLYAEEMAVTREGVLVKGLKFNNAVLRYYLKKKVQVRYNIDGEPTHVIAMLDKEPVQLWRNTEKETQLVEGCKNFRQQDMPSMRRIEASLYEGALKTLPVHTPGSAHAKREAEENPEQVMPTYSPGGKVRLPVITKSTIQTDL